MGIHKAMGNFPFVDTWLHDSSAYTHAYFAHIDHIKTSLSTLYKLGVYLDKHQEVWILNYMHFV